MKIRILLLVWAFGMVAMLAGLGLGYLWWGMS